MRRSARKPRRVKLEVALLLQVLASVTDGGQGCSFTTEISIWSRMTNDLSLGRMTFWVISERVIPTRGSIPHGQWRRKMKSFDRRQTAATQVIENKCPSEPVAGRAELDSHADTCVLGRNFVVLSYTGRECDVIPYTDQYKAVAGVPIVTGATAYTDQDSGETIILVINEALYMPTVMPDSLLNPNQLRAYGTVVQDNPYSGAPMYIADPQGTVTVPLKSTGTTIFADTRTPTEDELSSCLKVELTSAHMWRPNMVKFPEPRWTIDEDRISQGISATTTRREIDSRGLVDSEGEDLHHPDLIFNLHDFNERLIRSVQTSVDSQRRVVAEVQLASEPTPNTFVSKDRRGDVSPEKLADRWMIGLDQAILTLKNTTQRLVRSAMLPLARRYKADRIFNLPRLLGEWFTDTIDARCTSIDGNKYAQIFANESFFATIYPMDKKSKAGDALRVFCNEFGVPESLRHDGSKEQCEKNTEFQKQVRRHDIVTKISEPAMHNQSPAEGIVREVKRKWFRAMVKKKIPKRFWDYGYRWVCETMQRTYLRGHRIDGGIPLQKVTGETVEIAEYLDFGIYDHVWYRDNSGLGENKLGRWLGVSKHVGGEMCYHILPNTGTPISRSTVWNLTADEKKTDEVKAMIAEFDASIDTLLGDDAFPQHEGKIRPEDWAEFAEDPEFQEEFLKVYENPELPEADDFSPDIDDECYLNMELALPRDGEGPTLARVKKRLRDNDGNPIGRSDANPILDTRLFEVEFLDGHTASMSANAIAEHMFAQVDQHGHRLLLLESIVDHRFSEDAIKEDEAFFERNNRKHRKRTTKGAELLMRYKDGSEAWLKLKDAKESFPLEVADYSIRVKIDHLPQFAWWVPYVVKKRTAIVKKVKSKYWQRTHKYGIRIPKDVPEAKRLDRDNQDTKWWDAICEQMKDVRVAFEACDSVPVGHTQITCHMIFDVKLGENFRRKARFVGDGHKVDSPPSMNYSSVVSRDSVRIGLLIAALNNLDVFSCDIKNAYLTAPCKGKYYIIAGEEFGSDAGKVMKVVRALYGLPESGASFRSYLSEHLHDLGYSSSLADPDVYLRPAVAPNGFKYYEYVMTYVDDVLCISKNPKATIEGIKQRFALKGDRAGEPDEFLGAGLTKMVTANGTGCWAQSSDKYLAEAVKSVDAYLAEKGNKQLPTKNCPTPFSSGYRPEMDVSPELGKEGLAYYQELIGMLRWGIEIGRLDILLEVSLMSAYLASPREGHLEEVLHIFAYIKQHPKRKLAFDPDVPQIDDRRFAKHDWYNFYRDAKEAIPPNCPEPRGKPVSVYCFVDADLAGNKQNRRSQTGILIFVNRAPVMWHCKRQNTVESSTFGSEIVALKNAIELIEGLRYKLRMFGVEVEGPADIFCDNEAVTKNCSIPESTLKKKHHSIAYHRNREAVAAGTVRIAKEPTESNLADLFTKPLSKARRDALLDRFMY